ncbi:MAG: 16S rRNA (uracil(1498)-N(3))-methyltransferase [Microthrixaceae bacterium]|nr:16S rRNA (uracil(1498)-N(3))-methyltransferase [Microthrixaceae bacterium]
MGSDSSPGVEQSPWRAASAQVLVEDLSDPVIDDDASHHLSRVLRIGPEESVCAFDGAGGWVMCALTARGELEPLGEPSRSESQPWRATVGFAVLKGTRNELVVQKLTEVGIDRIWLLRTDRGVVRWDARRSERNLDRLRRIAVEASCQCRRLHLPEIELLDLRDAVGAQGRGVALADAGGRPPDASTRVLLVGPEGGWSPAERALRDGVALGGNVLRAETAAIVAGSTLAQLRIGLVGPGLTSLSP